MIISVVLVSMMVVFVTVYHFVTKPKKQQEKSLSKTEFITEQTTVKGGLN